MEITKVVIPVAGWGTRSLPATKNIPKEMLPIYKKPTVQYVVEEAQSSGLTDVVFINNQNKKIIEDHFDYNLTLERTLERAGKLDILKEVREVAEMVNIISVRQKVQLGLGHAVLCAKEVVKNDNFAVMVGDDLMFGSEPGIKQLIDVAKAENMPVIGVMEVPPQQGQPLRHHCRRGICTRPVQSAQHGGKTACKRSSLQHGSHWTLRTDTGNF